MFTGLVSDVGTVAAVAEQRGVRKVRIDCGYAADSIAIGASIAVAGICLTVVSSRARNQGASFEVEAAPETLAVTTADAWQIGTRVNLERSLKVGDELGGHIVSGHVDGIALPNGREDACGVLERACAAPRAHPHRGQRAIRLPDRRGTAPGRARGCAVVRPGAVGDPARGRPR
jgi:riboflavin synthase